MELNSHRNPLLKQGTVLPTGKGGLTKQGGGLLFRKNNPLGIKTFKSHKIWEIEEEFEVEKKDVIKSEKDDSEYEKMSVSEIGSEIENFYSDKAINERIQVLRSRKDFITPKSDFSVGGLSTGKSPTLMKNDSERLHLLMSGRDLSKTFNLRSTVLVKED